MQWKQLWTLPSEGGMWMLRQAGKWMEEAGRLEMSQWGYQPYDAVAEVVEEVNQVQQEGQQIQ